MAEDLTKLTVRGTEYTNVDGYSFVFVGDGIAFGETLAVETGYYVSLGPHSLGDLGDGEPTERTLYRTGSTIYVAADPDDPIVWSVPDYDIDGERWQYRDRLAVSDAFTVPSGDDEEYLIFSSAQQTDTDILLPLDEAKEHLRAGRIKQLWPVWQTAHR